MKKIYLVLYYSLAKFLPKSTMPIIGKFQKLVDAFCVNVYLHRVEWDLLWNKVRTSAMERILK